MKLKLLALVLAVAVAVSTVPASALEHLNPMPDDEQPPTLVDSGAPPVQPPKPPDGMRDLFFPDMLEPPAGELELEEKEPDYICTFGCTHGADEPCNFPEVEVIGAGAARVIVPKGRASVPITAIDLTSLGDGGGDTTLPCILMSRYDDSTHFKLCLNHFGTGTWNGTYHNNGKLNVENHFFDTIPPLSCNPNIKLPTIACKGKCGYKLTLNKPECVETDWTPNMPEYNYVKHCINCGIATRLEYCTINGYKLVLTCPNMNPQVGICQSTLCSVMHDTSTKHSIVATNGNCVACKAPTSVYIGQPSVDYLPNGNVKLTSNVDMRGFKNQIKDVYTVDFTGWTLQSINSVDNVKSSGKLVAEFKPIKSPMKVDLRIFTDYVSITNCIIMPTDEPPTISSATTSALGSVVDGWAKQRNLKVTMGYGFDTTLNVALFDTSGSAIIPYVSINSLNKIFTFSSPINLTVDGEENFIVSVKDNFNNESKKTIQLSKTDAVPPVFVPLTEDLTNEWARSKNVTLSATDIKGIGKVQIGFNNENEYKLAQDNGTDFSRTYSFFGDVYTKQVRPIYLKDGLGNAQQVLIEIDKLDNTAPTITDAKQSSVPPYNTASVMITANDEHPVLGAGSGIVEYAISLTDTTPVTGWQTSNRFTVPGNGTYYLWAKDAVGNVTTNKFAYTVDSMDDIPPTPPVITKSPDVPWTTSDITVEIGGSTDPDGIGVKEYQYQLNGGSWAVYNAPFTISETTEIKAKAIDMAGNESDITTAHANIDRINPLGTFSSATEWTNKPVTVTFTGTDTGGAGVRRVRPADGKWVDGDTTTQEVAVNGTYKFEVEDNAGNTALVTHTIENIDFRAPDVSKISFTKPPDSFFRSLFSLFEPKVEMYITAVDAEADEKSGKSEVHEIEYQLVKKGQYAKPNAWKPYPVGNEDNLPEVPAQFNGVLAARSIDTAGNVSSPQSIQITLEETPPKATHTLSTTDWTCEPVIITVKATDADSGISAITCPDKSTIAGDTATFSAGVNGIYEFKVIDKAGNVLDYSVTISNIDLTPPKAMHTVAKGKIVITATDLESGMAAITCSHGESKADKKECSVMPGQHVYQITDKAGNTFSYPVAVSGLKVTIAGDKTKNSEPDEPEPAAEPNPETGGIMCNTNIRAAAAGADADYVTTN